MTKNAKKVLILILTVLPLVLTAQDIVWQQQFQGMYNGQLTCAYSGGFHSAKPAMVDIDADRDLDLFVGEDMKGLTFIQNDGTATTPRWVMQPDSYSDVSGWDIAPAFCDIDADGDYDLFYGGYNGEIRFWRNDGNATTPQWTKVSETFEGLHFSSHAVPTFFDIDNDSDFDLFVGKGSGTISFFRNEGSAQSYQFVQADTQYAALTSPHRLAPSFVDIDNDSDYDLFVGDERNILFYRNTGTAASPVWVKESEKYADFLGQHYLSPIFPDIDGDGDFDMIVADAHYDLTLFENIGTPESPAWEHVTDYYATIDIGYNAFPAFADMDNDGDLEIYCGAHSQGGLIQILNDGTAEVPSWTCNGDQFVSDGMIPFFCDIDNDGDNDLFAGAYNTFLFIENQGTATVPNMAAPITDYNSINLGDFTFPTLCDIDNDQDFDLFIGKDDGRISYYQNIGTVSSPAWAEPDHFYQNIETRSIRSTPTFCDLDQDGDYDLFVGDYTGTISYYRNTGTATAPTFELVTRHYGGIQVDGHIRPLFADIDNDADPDLFLGGPDGGLLLWLNMGNNTAVDESLPQFLPEQGFVLEQNYPNPFNPATTISYEIPCACFVELAIYNIHGQKMKALVNEHQPAGRHQIKWNGMSDTDAKITSGLYFYKISAGQFQESGRMLLLK